jgi:uncharacterized membrane protein
VNSSRVLRRVMIAVAVVGLGVATYLTVVHYVGPGALVCTASHGGTSPCEQVQFSSWAKVAGIPVALLGLVGYILILGTLLAPDREEWRLATLGVTLFGFAFSGYLTYRELFSIKAICEWCVSSAVMMTLLFGMSVARYLLGDSGRRVAVSGDGVSGDGGSSTNGHVPEQLAQPRA